MRWPPFNSDAGKIATWPMAKRRRATWRDFVVVFLRVFVGTIAAVYLFILLIDPYGFVPFSLPLDRRIVSIADRYMYPQVVRSKRFDSLIIGTSTSRLLDPEILDREFHVHFANLAFYSGTPWEQTRMLDYFVRKAGTPKVLIVGLDSPWCDPRVDRHRITERGFPDWMYDDNPWNDYLHLFNYSTLEIAVRMVGNQFGLYPERIRYDGYDVFVPPESEYDAARAHNDIWRYVRSPPRVLDPLTHAEIAHPTFPALGWLDDGLAKLPPATLKILAFMPVHVAAQPAPGSALEGVETACKAQIVTLAKKVGAKVIDWRIASSLTRNDNNYWDSLHYRVPIATHIAGELGPAALEGRQSEDGEYRILVP